MGIISRFFERKEEQRADEVNLNGTAEINSELLRLMLDSGAVSKRTALSVPAIASAVNLVANIIANVPYKLYSYDKKGRLVEEKDERVKIFNKNTGDMLNGFEMKRAFVRDYMLMGNGYIYKEMYRNKLVSLRYVDEVNVSVQKNSDPIFKLAKYMVNGREYRPDEFVTIARNTTDGVTGKGLLQENRLVIKLMNNMLKMLNGNLAGGGVKKGFLKSEVKLSEEAMANLRETFAKLYNNNDNAVVVLNKGLDFLDAKETSTEMQLSEIYEGIGDDVSEIIQVPDNIKTGKVSEEEYRNWFRNCIVPILGEIGAALNETLLLESEKDTYFWRADTSELENGDLKSMFEAYGAALKSNVMQLDEVREKMGLPPLGFNFITLGLDSVLYDPEKQIVYTPNTNMTQGLKGINKPFNGKINDAEE